MRISDWSSDVCSSDLPRAQRDRPRRPGRLQAQDRVRQHALALRHEPEWQAHDGRRIQRMDEIARRRSEEHTSELQSLMRISYAVFCLKKKNKSKKRSATM